jgi:tetratricopeptide (TPR) repeat protein
VPDEWYRDARWDRRTEEEFERRLRRARAHNRPQYLRVKALALLDHGGRKERRAARDLLQRVLTDYPDSLDVVVAREALGQICEREGDHEEAEAHYRAALGRSLEGHVHGDAQLRLPELLIRTGGTEKLADAEAILASIDVEGDLAFKSQRFRYAVCRARVAARQGELGEAAGHAAAALREARTDAPDFPRHPTIGHVDADRAVIRELERLAREEVRD